MARCGTRFVPTVDDDCRRTIRNLADTLAQLPFRPAVLDLIAMEEATLVERDCLLVLRLCLRNDVPR